MSSHRWLTLAEALERIRSNTKADDAQAFEQLRRQISAAGLVRPGKLPLPAGADTPLRVRVITERVIVGNDWLETPTLHVATSEIDCPWRAPTQALRQIRPVVGSCRDRRPIARD